MTHAQLSELVKKSLKGNGSTYVRVYTDKRKTDCDTNVCEGRILKFCYTVGRGSESAVRKDLPKGFTTIWSGRYETDLQIIKA